MSDNQVPTITNSTSGNSHIGGGESNFGIRIGGAGFRCNISNNSHNNTCDSVGKAEFGVTAGDKEWNGPSKQTGGTKRGQSPSSIDASRTSLGLTKDDVGVPPAHCSYTSSRDKRFTYLGPASKAPLEQTRQSENTGKHVDPSAKSYRQFEMAVEPMSAMTSELRVSSAATENGDYAHDLHSSRSSVTLGGGSDEKSTATSEGGHTPVEQWEIRDPRESGNALDGNVGVPSMTPSSVNEAEKGIEEEYDMVNPEDLA